MFIDASAIVATMTDEDDARHFARRMQASQSRMTSPLEAARAAIEVASLLGLPITETSEAVKAFLQVLNIQILAVPPRAAMLAAEAYDRFGKGRHEAALDLEDCMTYACARYYRQPLLFKAARFSSTDIDVA